MNSYSQARLHRRAVVLVVVLVASIVLTATTAGPADAKSFAQFRDTGRAASASWEQWDGTETGGPFGNVHIGYLTAEETTSGRASVWGWIDDFDCEEGEKPWGGHGEDEEEGVCAYLGDRWIEADGLAFSMDRKMTTATLVGELIVYGGGHGDGGELGRPPANIVWTGLGGTYTSRYTARYRDGDTTFTETWRSTERSATVDGNIGPMGFDPDLSSGYLSSYRTSFKSRTK
jgi:hypothetical protein